MKKTLIAIALAAMVAPAWGAEVVSSNIVGYQKVTVPAGMTILGQQFTAVGGGTNDIQTITGQGLVDGGSDEIMVWNGSEYEDYYYYTETDDIKGDGTAAWGDLDWNVVNVPIPAGMGMWMLTQGTSTITFAGEVGSNNTVEFQAGLNLITQTLPSDVNIQDVTGVGLVDGGSDEIMIWNGSEYADYYYYTETDDIKGDGTAAWGDLDWNVVNVTLPAGKGFWLLTQGSGTLTFPAVSAP